MAVDEPLDENPEVLGLDLSLTLCGSKTWLITEHLTLADLNARGETPKSDGVVRASLCDNREGDNPLTVYECQLKADDAWEIRRKKRMVDQWASGFIVGARAAGLDLGIIHRPSKASIFDRSEKGGPGFGNDG